MLGAAEAGFAAMGGIAILFFVIAIAASIFWIWMLIDALMNEPTPAEKLLWFCVIFFLHLLGALIYLLVRRNHRTGLAG
jgi:hypothetical protein